MMEKDIYLISAYVVFWVSVISLTFYILRRDNIRER